MENKKSTIVKDALALFAITLVSGLALGAVYGLTKPVIEKNKLAAETAAYKAVYADAVEFQSTDALTAAVEDCATILANSNTEGITINSAYEAVDASGNVIGYVMSATSSKGFGGDIQISLGVTNEGQVTGIEFLVLSETAGLGMKAEEPEFKDQFVGKTVDSFEVVKADAGENQINAISGATITSKAVNNAVNASIYFAKTVGGN